jgi:hypothetical protein
MASAINIGVKDNTISRVGQKPETAWLLTRIIQTRTKPASVVKLLLIPSRKTDLILSTAFGVTFFMLT